MRAICNIANSMAKSDDKSLNPLILYIINGGGGGYEVQDILFLPFHEVLYVYVHI